MKNEKDLDRLFSALRNETPEISFDEVSSQFRKNADSGFPRIQLKKSQWFTLKNFLIMVTLILTAGMTFLFMMNPSEQVNEITNEIQVNEKRDTVQTELVTVKKEILLPSFPERRVPVYSNENDKASAYLQPVITVDTNEQVKGTFTHTIRKEVYGERYVFPKLTEDEIDENNKQKRSMLKALEKTDKREYAFIPSGKLDKKDSNVSVNAFYMQRTEVSNLEYRTFLFDLLIQGRKDEFLLAKPDQQKWTELFGSSNQSMEDLYFTHTAYNDYPVVNVSREGAEMYCKWLREEVNKVLKEKDKPGFQAIRLPLRDEWIYAASSGGKTDFFPWNGERTINDKGIYLANYRPFVDRYYDDGGFYPVDVMSYPPNGFGLYNMAGNVAEMVYESSSRKSPGTAGGGWLSDEEELHLFGTDAYAGVVTPHPNIGFRVVFSHL